MKANIKIYNFGYDKISFSLYPKDSKSYTKFFSSISLYLEVEQLRKNKNFYFLPLNQVFDVDYGNKKRTANYCNYKIRCKHYDIEFTRPENAENLLSCNSPLLFLNIRPYFLAYNSIKEVTNTLKSIHECIPLKKYHIYCLEQYIDFMGWNIDDSDIKDFKCLGVQARREDYEAKYSKINIINFGKKKANIKCKFYNKTREVLDNRNNWYFDSIGADKSKEIWRIEFVLRRKFLRSVDINNLRDAVTKASSLWKYCTVKWLIYQPEGVVHPLWCKIQSVFGNGLPLKRLHRKTNYSINNVKKRIWKALVDYGALTNETRLLVIVKLIINFLTINRGLFSSAVKRRQINIFDK